MTHDSTHQKSCDIFNIKNLYFKYQNDTNPTLTSPQNITINHLDIILLTGESGCGKSTFFHILKGLIPDFIPGKISGDILYHEENLFTLTENQKNKIALLWQNPDAQFINSDVYKELALPLENMGIDPKDIEHKINECVEKFNIHHLINKKAHELSGGEKQKINLIALLLRDPDVLLLDEPTAFLDTKSINMLIQTLKHISPHKTIIIIEHNHHYFKDLINRHFVINKNGEIREEDIRNIQWEPIYNIPKNAHHTNATNHNPLLHIKHYARKDYYQINNFTIYKQDIIGINGDNGIGKSTLLHAIAKLIKTDKKSIYYNNQDITDIHWKKYFTYCTLLFQNSEHHFLYNSVIEETDNLDILDKIGLKNKTSHNPFSLSEGQKRRLSLAILWNMDCELYLLDEPTFGQDLKNKNILCDMIYNMNTLGKTFVIISHDLPFLKAICNKVYQLTSHGLTHL